MNTPFNFKEFALEYIQEAVYLIDKHAKFVYVNLASSLHLGYTKDELLTMGVADVDADFPMERWGEHWDELTKRKNLLFSTTHRTKYGLNIPVEVNANLIMHEGEAYNIALIREKTEQHILQKELHFYESYQRTLLDNFPFMVWLKDKQSRLLTANTHYAHLTNIKSVQELEGKTDFDLFPTHLAQKHINDDQSVMQEGVTKNAEEMYTDEKGKPFWIETWKTPVSVDGEIVGIVGCAHDITERKNQEEQLKEKELAFRTLAENSPDAIVRYDTSCRKIYVNNTMKEFFNVSSEQLLGQTPNESGIFSKNGLYESKLKEVIQTRQLTTFELTYPLPTNETGWVELRMIPEFNDKAELISVLVVGRDMSERKKAEERIAFLAHHDALTKLPNRILLQDRAEHAIAHAKRTRTKNAVLFIDLDKFKAINDSLGHDIGDKMLQQIASRLKALIRKTDTLSRQGGDEFLVILTDIHKNDDVIVIVRKILHHFEAPFNIDEHVLFTSVSIGIALYPDDGENFEALRQKADIAMYQAKESGRNMYCFYAQEMNQGVSHQLRLQNDLKNAIKNNELVLHYQPQIDLKTNRIIGAEALLRWEHPELGRIAPATFIPLAESSGLIIPIGEWVLNTACEQMAQWHQMGYYFNVAVNISAVQFRRGNLEEVVQKALHDSKLNPRFLELELTESIMIQDTAKALQTVHALKNLGVMLSIDDFGTGYSSLTYLKRFKADKLKIDRSFIVDMLKTPDDAIIVKTIIQMAKSLGLTTIAEGVEDEEVLEVIDAYGCDEVQGYYFAKPMEAALITTHIGNAMRWNR